jgi:hypothetical protein
MWKLILTGVVSREMQDDGDNSLPDMDEELSVESVGIEG